MVYINLESLATRISYPKCYIKLQTAILDWHIEEEPKQDCTHVDHHQLDPFTIYDNIIVLGFFCVCL